MATTNPPQTYANHAHRPTAWTITWFICFAAALLSMWAAWRDRTLVAHVVMLLSFGLVGTVTVLRAFALRLQNRIVRLEMQVRMTRLGLEREFAQADLRQLIALRFASDTELPALARRTIAETLTPDQIKQAVTDWQGDFLRT